MKPFWQKIIMVVLGLLTIFLAAILIEDTNTKLVLIGLGSALVGWAGVRRPGDRAVVPLIPFVLALGASSCGTLGAISWPAVASCAAPISGALLEALTNAFVHKSKKELNSDLKNLAKAHGPEAVVCGAKQIRDDLTGATSEPGVFSATKLDPEKRHVVDRIDAFLGTTDTDFQ